MSNLWPLPIEIVGLTGEFASGKTLFGLTIDPKNCLLFDTEKSAGSYHGLGFTRVDIPTEMLKAYPGGYRPIQVYEWWLKYVRSIPAGKYRVIGLDTVSEIETGLTDWVQKNPQHFGRTAAQYIKMSGLMWSDIKELWKNILSDLSARCETFFFTSHLTNVWSGDKPLPGKRKAKGKDTLMELASLYLHMERRADQQGNIPAKPSAVVLKSRLLTTSLGADGELVMVPTLPPRLPVATPAAIREYMQAPPDYDALRPDERAPEASLSADDRALLALSTAEAERDAAAYKLESMRIETTPQERPGRIVQPDFRGGERAPVEQPPQDEIKAISPWLQRIQHVEENGSEEQLDEVREEMNAALKKRTRTQGEVLRRALEMARAAIRARARQNPLFSGTETAVEQQEGA